MSFSEKETLALDVLEACQAAVGAMESMLKGRARNRVANRLWEMVSAAMSGDELRQRASLVKLQKAVE